MNENEEIIYDEHFFIEYKKKAIDEINRHRDLSKKEARKQIRNRTLIMGVIISLLLFFIVSTQINNYYHDYAYTNQGSENDIFVLDDQNIDISLDWANELSTDVIRGTVRVNTAIFFDILGIKILSGISYGSGGIFNEDMNYYYVLTNNHVVYVDSMYRSEYIIFDYKNRPIKGELLSHDPLYDLATIRFPKENVLKVLSLADSNPEVGDLVVSIGNPLGQSNCIAFGIIDSFNTVNSDSEVYESNVTFECIIHTFVAKSGSSGGVLLNENNEIVGINTFGKQSSLTTSGYTAAIPLEEIINFLNQ